jgi:choline dehydrogenase-like flavoprotein
MVQASAFYIKASSEQFDAIVVGSGITGGWAAKELCERGLRTLMVERGRPVEHRTDYIGEGIDPWKMPNRGLVDHELAQDQFDVQRKCYAFDEHTKHFFIFSITTAICLTARRRASRSAGSAAISWAASR